MRKTNTLAIFLLVFVVLLGYVLFKYERSEYEKISAGKVFYEEIRKNAPNCWLPERRVLFKVGCQFGSDEVRTELAIILSSCVSESKGIPHVVCDRSKLSTCHLNRNCLYECGMKYGIYVSAPRMGFNVFERMFESVPLMCKYILNDEHTSVEPFDWDLFQDVILSNKDMNVYNKILANPGDYTAPHLMNLQHLFLEKVSTVHRCYYHTRSFLEFLLAWAATPTFWYTLLIGIIVFFVLCWLFGKYWCI